MLKTTLICDLCGKPIEKGKKKYRIKESKLFQSGNGLSRCWVGIDAHDECIRVLFETKKKQENEKEGKHE